MILILICQTACRKQSFLDPVISNDLTKESVFSDSVRTMQYLNNIYSTLNMGVPPQGIDVAGFQVASLSDEAEIKWVNAASTPNIINVESLGQRYIDVATGIYRNYYQKIRAVAIYLAEVDKAPLSVATKNRTKAEARFLRAYYYSCLMKYFGGIPILGDDVKTESSEFDVLRSPYGDCVNYLVKELEEIAPVLPLNYTGIDYGRITRGAALALKGKVLLYAASPFFNGGGVVDNPNQTGILTYPNSDPNRWRKAFDALRAVVDMPGNPYSLEQGSKPGEGFYNLFLKRVNSEYILAFMQAPNRNMERYLLPPSRDNSAGGGYSGVDRGLDFPTQELVDAFPMRNGKGINETGSGYDLNNPYAGRDPRFYYSIIYNGSNYISNVNQLPAPVFTFTGTGSTVDAINPSSGAATKTGYYGRKMCDTTVTINVGSNVNRSFPLIRYADVLLMYAEAANEIGETGIAMAQMRAIRQRAGITEENNYGLPAAPGQAELRTLIKNERMVELAFENSRMFDIKRWKSGETLLNKAMTGMRITKTGNNYTYTRIAMPIARIFTSKSYLWPIPQRDVNNNPDFVKNPGW